MRRILFVLLAGVVTVFLSAQAQTISTHEIVKVLSAQGDVTSSDMQAALGQWQLELFNLPHKTDFFQAQYVVDADGNGRFEVGVDPVYTIMGYPRLATAQTTVFCNIPMPFVEIRIYVLADFEVALNGQAQGMKQFGTMLFLSTGDVRGPWIMMLSVDLDNDGTSEGIMGVSTWFAVPIIPPQCP